MRQYLLDLLHNNPLPTGAIVAHLQRFPVEGVDHRKVADGLQRLEREGEVVQRKGEQDELGAKMGYPPLMEWHRTYGAPRVAGEQMLMF